jgi:hypothetical protein
MTCPICDENLAAIRSALADLNAAVNRLQHPRVLVGWTSISEYLQTPVSTCRAWRRDQALPVMSTGRRRHGYSVLTSTSLLDSWIQAASQAFQSAKRGKRSIARARRSHPQGPSA